MNLSESETPGRAEAHEASASAAAWVSGRGKTSGRGHKGAKSVSGYSA